MPKLDYPAISKILEFKFLITNISKVSMKMFMGKKTIKIINVN